MKTFLAIAVLALAATCTSAAPSTRAIDWAAVSQKVVDIEERVKTAAWDVLYAADSGAINSTTFLNIYEKVKNSSEQAGYVLYGIQDAIQNQTLNATQVETFNDDLKAIMGKLLGSISADLEGLDAMSAEKIRTTFMTLFDDLNRFETELVALVSAPAEVKTPKRVQRPRH